MTVFSGFFNSNNDDRKYNAEHFGKFFDGLICDGVYVNFPQDEDDETEKAFYVKPGTGLQVSVAPGRGWFLNTYIYNDADLLLAISSTPSSLQSRIDAIVLDINPGDDVRNNQIIVVEGSPGTNPDRPSLINQPTHKQFPIAFVTIPGGATSISQSNIVQCVGTDDPDAIPAVEALLELSSKSKKELQDQIDDITEPTFTEAENIANINSGENINTMWGKVKKMFSTIIAGLPINMGGTGATTARQALINLGVPTDIGSVMTDIATRDKNFADNYDPEGSYYDEDFAMFDGVLKKYSPSQGAWFKTSFAEEVKELYRLAYKVDGTPSYDSFYNNPGNSAFSARSVPVNYSLYDYIEIFYRIRIGNNNGNVITSVKLFPNQTSNSDPDARYSITYKASIMAAGNTYYNDEYKRDVVLHKTKNLLSFDDVELWRTTYTVGAIPSVNYDTISSMPSLNEYIVPVKIYGVKINSK